MNVIAKNCIVKEGKWARYKYNLTNNIGENGSRITGCDEHIALSRKVASEGMVLLENNGFLPLKPNTKVSLFGVGSLDYIKGGGGSGRVYPKYVHNIYEGLKTKSDKISIYEPLTKFYYDYLSPIASEITDDANVISPEIELPDELIINAANNSDAAVISIHRYSREGFDRLSEKGDFYLTDIEQNLVNKVTAAFEHTVVVLNVGGMVDVSWIKENKKIDAALLAWQAGMEGGLAIADILCGDVNPSGKLTDTFAKSFADYPCVDTFHESEDYVCYYEDIYVGYRYFETVKDASNKVNYPFGYGLSYTDFEIEKPVALIDNDKIKITTSVKNIGKLSGKEVVQVYYSAPQGVLGKAKVSLAGFKKTKLLSPNETENIEIEFNISDMASYDDLGKLKKSAFLLEKGEYNFFVGNNCRNLKQADLNYKVSDEYIVTKQLTSKCAPNKLEKRMLSSGEFEALPCFPLKIYDKVEAPKNNATPITAERPIMFSAVAEGKISLDEFMTQLTDEELILLMSGTDSRGVANTAGIGGISRLGIPAFMTVDGPAGVRLDSQIGIPTTAWPCATLIASTWNTDLAYEIGRAGALESKENGLAIWLTPALNIHRNPLCGRNFEYFSEDPLVSGKFAAAKVKGIQSVNVAASVKHFACNNKETNRKMSDSRISERALREIYMRGFEICVKESEPWTIMSSYNLINARRCCASYEQTQGILRDEWGYKGLVVSDWWTPCEQKYCVLSGNDVRMPDGEPEKLKKALENGEIERSNLEVCAKRILELALKFD